MTAFLQQRPDKAELRKRVVDLCYDVTLCEMVGIDYSRITEGDIVRIQYLLATDQIR